MKEMIKQLITGKRGLSDIWHYIVGSYRHKLYYKTIDRKWGIGQPQTYKKPDFMRQHIWEQIQHRIQVMNPLCYSGGSCIKCGCQTTQLQMASKACEGDCYPAMMNAKEWEKYKTGSMHIDNQRRVWIYRRDKKKHILYIETPIGYVPRENI